MMHKWNLFQESFEALKLNYCESGVSLQVFIPTNQYIASSGVAVTMALSC